MTESIKLTRDAEIALVRLNRPQAYNAIDPELVQGLAAQLMTLAADPEVRPMLYERSWVDRPVEHVAKLARLEFSPEEKEIFTRQLDAILTYVDKLNELDTAGVEPTSHVLPINNVFRDDVPRPSLAPDDALMNAPDRAEDFYRVPKIIE